MKLNLFIGAFLCFVPSMVSAEMRNIYEPVEYPNLGVPGIKLETVVDNCINMKKEIEERKADFARLSGIIEAIEKSLEIGRKELDEYEEMNRNIPILTYDNTALVTEIMKRIQEIKGEIAKIEAELSRVYEKADSIALLIKQLMEKLPSCVGGGIYPRPESVTPGRVF